ncbi:fructosamine-3-kinase [Elysia marginata]|uniref:protein-ribulosamine 3-kinase n=1 Tax=Elysia marginata TaxID=1093978 RepID=A0AAV4I6P1_9GAST|nr:fructosamine-3-kinase [Elysia marginata]
MAEAEEVLKAELQTSTLKRFGCQQSGCINDGLGYLTDHGPRFVKFNSHTQERMAEAEEVLKAELQTSTLERFGCQQSGCINDGLGYLTDHGPRFVKFNSHAQQRRASLKAEQTITSKCQRVEYEDKFGFHVPTYAGYSRQGNTWDSSWVNFFARKMEDYVNLIEQKHNDRDARPLWHCLVPNLPRLFRDVSVEPALIHGDLWRGNVAQSHSGPVSFDPIALYGHSEFELSIMFKHGGFPPSFFKAYYSLIPKAPGFEHRYQLYSLHHHFQIWSHFGGDFVEDALGIVEPEVFRSAFGKGFKASTLEILTKLDKVIN